MGLAARIDAATPAERDRYLDFLRVAAIAMVILGHWTVRVVTETDGRLVAAYLLAVEPRWIAASPLWQVMPVFFMVGGLLNAASWRRARDRGEAPMAWVRGRARRLLFPALPLLAVLVPAAAIVHARAGPGALVLDFGVAIIPLWFLAVYLVVTALAPATLALHERGGSPGFVALLLALAVALDLARFLWGGPILGTQPAVAGPNFALIWLAIHQLGYLWADGRLPGRRGGQLGLAAAAAAALAAMIGPGPYPLAMVPIEGTQAPNNGSPPSAALFALALVQLGLILAARGPVTRWLARPRAWAAVALTGPRIITLFLWHQAAMIAVANLALPAGWFPLTAGVDATWWALRPLWIAACLAVLVPVALAVHPLGRPPDRDPGPAGVARTAAGVALFGAGVAGLIGTRLVAAGMPLGLPLLPLAALAAGMAALGVLGPLRRPGRGPG